MNAVAQEQQNIVFHDFFIIGLHINPRFFLILRPAGNNQNIDLGRTKERVLNKTAL